MLFTSTTFLLFFLPALLILYFIIPQRFLRLKNILLLVFSLVFYAFGGVRFLLLLVFSIAVNYSGGLAAGLLKTRKAQTTGLILTVAVNVALLGYFKYAGFAAEVLSSLGLPIVVPKIALPIGISFFTFQGMSYVIDVYRKDVDVQKNPLSVALYIALFPQLMSGPIVRYTAVEESLRSRRHSAQEVSEGLTRFLFGFGKKLILAGAMGNIADAAFKLDASTGLTCTLAWLGAIAYTLQIYFDFSGYSDMAIGLARVFGFRYPENFNYPYMASSVTDFWRRWHISLSSWFRDYVYIPLGGNRCATHRHILNLLVVWALTGLWHGANFTFIAWGLYFCFWLILEKYPLAGILPRIPAAIRHILTLLIVIVSWVLFRSSSIGAALGYLKVMFIPAGALHGAQTVFYIRQYAFELVLCVIACFPIAKILRKRLESRQDKPAAYALNLLAPKVIAAVVFAYAYLKLISGSFSPFIYFQF